MGYFDTLISSYFKTAPDGRKLFYPWGIWGRGYVVASEADEKRLRQQMKTLYVIIAVVMILGYALYSYIGALVAGALCIACYAGWARYLVRGLASATEKLTIGEAFAAQAHASSAGMLWFSEIVVAVLFALSIAMLILEPAERMTAAAGVAVFGLCTAMFGWMLVLKRRKIQH